MLLISVLLFTLPAGAIDTILKIVIGVASTAIGYWIVRYFNSVKEASEKAVKERDEMCERIDAIENLIKVDNPAFQAMREEVKTLNERVHVSHEQRFTGIVLQQETFSKLYELKLENSDKKVADLEKKLDKLDVKLDKIYEAVMKGNTH